MEEQFIPGIYNYCDRWCERCSFTTRCRNYESVENLTPEQQDIHNEAFWKKISDNFKQAMQMLQDLAEKEGIDLDSIMSSEEAASWEKKREETDQAVRKTRLILLCEEYQKLARPFLKENFPEELVSQTRTLHSNMHMGIETPETVVNTMATLGDCSEVIQWYLFFIEVKLIRALSQKFEGDEPDDFPKDSDGSAKIAVIAVERSMGAWARLFELLPDTEDVSLQTLAILSKIKTEALLNFPDAMKFVRPGFDE